MAQPLDERTQVNAPGGGALGLREALKGAIRGDVWFDNRTLAVYATDSSNYRQVPLGVVCPVDASDLVEAMRIAGEFDVPVLARGAGTSLAGQACNTGLVLDTSRHMTRILEIDPERRVARVEPGVVLDDLRRAAAAFGLTFGPDPATHAWCTLGGMIGNNSCGAHGLIAGNTVDNVQSLKVALYGGEVLEVGWTDADERQALAKGNDTLGTIIRELEALIDDVGADIRARYPRITRRVSGYNLDQLLPERGFHLARALVGTESTVVVVTEATLSLIPALPARRLVVIGYPDVYDAADAVPALIQQPISALEGFDVELTTQMRARAMNTLNLELLPDGKAWLLAEIAAASPEAADADLERLLVSLPQSLNVRVLVEPDDQARMWAVRESSLAATAIRLDGRHNLEGWEDAAVPPERLAEYLRGIGTLWQRHGYSGAWYGHFGQGCVHTRNDFDLKTTGGLASYRAYVEAAADLVVSLGGSLSGEHGDGQARGELLERMYGTELVQAFERFRRIFDPRGRMNPGKVVEANPLDGNLRFGPDYRVSKLLPTYYDFGADGGSLQHAAERCVGVGRCLRTDSGVMCPSYRATREEVHSTRGRAKLLVELYRGEVTPETWRNDDVREALELCLACKGCAVDCPASVDMATYKSEFMAHYYSRRLRPRAMYALAAVPRLARLAALQPRVANFVMRGRGISKLVRWVGGLSTSRELPAFASPPWRRTPAARDRASSTVGDATVLLFADTFTDAFRPEAARDLLAVLELAGEQVATPRAWSCCGRTLYDAGLLDTARGTLKDLVASLAPWIDAGIPVVVPEPSCLAAFRDELPHLLSDDPRALRLATLARSPSEHLLTIADRLPRPVRGARVVVHPHCHGRAVGTHLADRELLADLGFGVEVLDAGCCGLAGSFGFRAEHDQLARSIGSEHWLPKVVDALAERFDAGPGVLVVEGFSCATQLDHVSDLESTTLVGLLRSRLPAPDVTAVDRRTH